MSFPAVLERGNEFIDEYPRTNIFWHYLSHLTCLAVVGFSKLCVYSFYSPHITGLENLDIALKRSKEEGRCILTIMNHMSTVDDPFVWGMLPYKYFAKIDEIRWGLGASNVCFTSPSMKRFFSLGKILSTERFGRGPFQGSIDASIRIMSPDDTLDLEYFPQIVQNDEKTHKLIEKLGSSKPLKRSRPSWLHIFPEGFVMQLEPPHNNSMRYFKWGTSRVVLESTKPPIIVPMFGTGFEKIMPEAEASGFFNKLKPKNMGHDVNLFIGEPLDDEQIIEFREQWKNLVNTKGDAKNAVDMNEELKTGKDAQDLRSRVAGYLREQVAAIRHNQAKLPQEDPRFASVAFWERFTGSEGASDPDIKFIGKNWAIKRLQAHLKDPSSETDEK